MSTVNEALIEVFGAHGIDAALQGECVVFPNSPIRANGSIVREVPQPVGMSVQLDVRFEIGVGRIIVESFAGLGQTADAAATDAFRNFVLNSFHVLLAAFFHSETDQVAQEEWTIGGTQRQVTVGNAGVRGKPPLEPAQLLDRLERFQELIKEKSLGPETHWVRLYYGQSQGKALACEVLLDNEVWETVQAETAALDWPADDAFYSIRLFLVIDGEKGEGITPESAVVHLAEFLAANPDRTEEEIYQALAAAGIPDALADRAYKFTQVAWGRLILDGMKIDMSSDYLCFDANGDVAESGKLADERCFAAALRLGLRYGSTPAFERMAFASAEVDMVNKALHAGSKPENLTIAPVGIFLEQPTSAGLQKAQKVISEHASAIRHTAAPRSEAGKPPARTSQWQFWKR